MNKTLREQLRPLSRWISNLPASPNSWRKEGEDHINIDRLSQTNAGRILCMDSITAWEHPMLGRFTSLNNFWYFLKAKNRVDALRTAHPRDLRIMVEKTGGRHKDIKNFMQIVLWGIYYRVKHIGAASRELLKTDLPFDSYRSNPAGIRSRNNTAHWLVEGYEEIRRAMKEEREPNFTRIAPLEGSLEDLHKSIVEEILNQPKVDRPVEEFKPRKPKKKPQRPREEKATDDQAPVQAGEAVTEFVAEPTVAPVEASAEPEVLEPQVETPAEAAVEEPVAAPETFVEATPVAEVVADDVPVEVQDDVPFNLADAVAPTTIDENV